ncbi:MAG: dihydrodipicolinate synthase family protein [Candidatus Limnocylindria bacterium]
MRLADLLLPAADGSLRPYTPGIAPELPAPALPLRSRAVLAAAHVVVDPLADVDPGSASAVDWEATLAYRRHLWSLGLGVADAMDTAQRGAGLGWPAARELIRLATAEARLVGGRIACGAGTDQLEPGGRHSLADVERAYAEQCELIEREGAQVVLMASRDMAAVAAGPEDYAAVYGRLLAGLSRPAILHWLGAPFDPLLAGYWGSTDLDRAGATLLEIIAARPDRVDGVKVSLLDASREVALRRAMPAGTRVYTGDDLNYLELIRGDEEGHSDALLGVFDAIAPAAAAAIGALDGGDLEGYERILAPTVPLARHLFRAPTYHYKTGIVLLAYLNGHQSHFRMLGGLESARSLVHIAELFVLADQAGILADPQGAAARMRPLLELGGISGA